MKEKKIEITLNIYITEELSAEYTRLRTVAIEAAKSAYAPYSSFHVGAAVLLADGTVIRGNNQENAVYPSGLCAERVALFHAGACFPDSPVDAIAVVAIKDGEIQPSVSPCGGCRQVMLETEQRQGRDIRILMCGLSETVIASSVKDLLPLCFGKDNLGVAR